MIAVIQQLILRVKANLRSEDGFALVVALGMSVVLGISGTTAVAYSTQNQTSSSRSRADRSAQSLAEAGLAYAYSTLFGSGTPTMPNAVPSQTIPMNGGTFTYYGVLNGQTWTLVGVGRIPNPAAQSGDVLRTARGKASVGSASTGTANNAVWNYVYSDSTTTCMPLENSVEVDVPLYVRGDICLKNSAKIKGPVIHVGGKVTMSNTSQIGELGDQIPEIHIAGGCQRGSGALHNPCGPVDLVYGDVVDSSPAVFTKPPIELEKWYQEAAPGPMHPCTTGSFPGGFDNDTVMNKSRGDVQLYTSTAYDCQVHDAQGMLLGQIKWTPGSPGWLVISGTVFIDGNLVFQNSARGVYQGRGTIYASGKITFNNSNDFCGSLNCDDDWDPLTNLVALIAGSSTDADGIEMVNSTRFQGALYAVNDIRERNSAEVWGPMIGRQIYLMNSVENHYVPIGTPLTGMPATYTEAIVISHEVGSWTG